MGKVDFDAIRATVEAEDIAADKRRGRAEDRTYFKWSAELTDKLIALIDQQKTAEEIAEQLGVPVDKVRSKIAAIKAREPAALVTKPEPVPKAKRPMHSKQLDRVVFYAFDELTLRLHADGEDPSQTFRCALDMLDHWAEGQREQIEYMPAAAPHFAAIGAIMSYQKITGKQIQADDGIEKAACGAGTP